MLNNEIFLKKLYSGNKQQLALDLIQLQSIGSLGPFFLFVPVSTTFKLCSVNSECKLCSRQHQKLRDSKFPSFELLIFCEKRLNTQ